MSNERTELKLIELKAQNVKRLVAVTIRPDGSLYCIGGQNEQGKSSVLDAILFGLEGKAALPDMPVRIGASAATVELDLGRYLLTRTLTDDGRHSFKMFEKDGSPVRSPQAVLDALYGRMLDPEEFLSMKPSDQVETVKKLAGLDLGKVEVELAKLREQRTSVGRDVKGRESQVASMPHYPDVPAQEVSVGGLAQQLKAAHATNQRNAGIRSGAVEAGKVRGTILTEIAKAKQQIEAWQKTLAAKEDSLRAHDENAKGESEIAKLQDADTGAIEKAMADAEAVNAKVRANAIRAQLKAQFDEAHGEYQRLTGEMEAVEAGKAKSLADAQWPIDGVGFNELGLTFNGVPFCQCSSEERLRVSVGMAFALNPALKLVLIKEGCKFDTRRLALLAEMATVAGAQVIVERVGEGEECAVIIEDGMVKGGDRVKPASEEPQEAEAVAVEAK